MDTRKYQCLAYIYGKELGDLEVSMFGIAYDMIDAVDELYRSMGFCLKDKAKTARIYHEGSRNDFLDQIYNKVVTVANAPDCQNTDAIKEMFPLPIYPDHEISRRSISHANELFTMIKEKLPEKLDETIWAAKKAEGVYSRVNN